MNHHDLAYDVYMTLEMHLLLSNSDTKANKTGYLSPLYQRRVQLAPTSRPFASG